MRLLPAQASLISGPLLSAFNGAQPSCSPAGDQSMEEERNLTFTASFPLLSLAPALELAVFLFSQFLFSPTALLLAHLSAGP